MNVIPPLSAGQPVALPHSSSARIGDQAALAVAAPSSPVLPNPRLRLDAGLGMVVLEMRDQQGEVARSIPTPRELEAYHRATLSGDRASSPPGWHGSPEAPAAAEPAEGPAPEGKAAEGKAAEAA